MGLQEMQHETGKLVEHQPGQPGDGQPVVVPALSWQVHGGGGGEDDAWHEYQQEKGEGGGDPLDDQRGSG